jgi:hypothetical protein
LAEKTGMLKLLVWKGIVLFFIWFLIYCFAPVGVLNALAFPVTKGLFLRIFGIFPLSWAVLFLFAVKDIQKNLAIINSAIITGASVIIATLIYFFTVDITLGWFIWLSLAVLLVYNLALFILKPKAA